MGKEKRTLVFASENCKSCGFPIQAHVNYCPNCGAKRIENRLNARNLLEDFNDRFLNVENSFLRTFIALFKRPEDVIDGYINGMRKKYISAFGYFAISLTFAGFYVFIFNEFFMDSFSGTDMGFGEPQSKKGMEVGMAFGEQVLKYQSLITFATIPLLALVSKITFLNLEKYNYIEHLVIFLYVYSHYSLVTIRR